MDSFVEIKHDGHVGFLTINRPDKLNALSREVLMDLRTGVAELGSRHDVRVVILTGAGKAFVAGADIAAMTRMTPAEAREFASLGHEVFDALETMSCPVIAAVNGFALGGGCELALACDFIYASSKAKFGQPEVSLGVIPGFGGTQRLPRRVGPALARELVFTGKMIGADDALRIGLVNAVFDPEDLLAQATQTAEEIASKGPLAVAASKRVIRDGMDRPLPDANALERNAFGTCFETGDQREGMAAFLEKRSPSFEGR